MANRYCRGNTDVLYHPPTLTHRHTPPRTDLQGPCALPDLHKKQYMSFNCHTSADCLVVTRSAADRASCVNSLIPRGEAITIRGKVDARTQTQRNINRERKPIASTFRLAPCPRCDDMNRSAETLRFSCRLKASVTSGQRQATTETRWEMQLSAAAGATGKFTSCRPFPLEWIYTAPGLSPSLISAKHNIPAK